jgi:hypothetical protein
MHLSSRDSVPLIVKVRQQTLPRVCLMTSDSCSNLNTSVLPTAALSKSKQQLYGQLLYPTQQSSNCTDSCSDQPHRAATARTAALTKPDKAATARTASRTKSIQASHSMVSCSNQTQQSSNCTDSCSYQPQQSK